MHKKNKIFTITAGLFLGLCAQPQLHAQDVHFSQFYETPLWRNPALAGIFSGDLRLQAVYRTQWGNINTPYQTGSFNGEYKMPVGQGNDFMTLGLQLMYDKAGTTSFKTVHFLPALNYHKSLSDEKNMYLSLGFMGGFVQRSIDRSKITTDSQWDGTGYNPSLDINESTANYNLGYGDGSVGLSFNSGLGENENSNYYLGIAYHHFNRPKNSFYRNPDIELNAKWVYSFGVRFGVSPNVYMSIEGDHTRQGSYNETLAGTMVGIALDGYDFTSSQYNLYVGGYVRWKDAIIPALKLDYKPFTISLSYDINTSPLRTASQGRGGFEIGVVYQAFFDRDNSSRNAVRCPRY